MKLAHPGLWIAVASLGLVALVAVTSLERTAPGPVSRSHAGVPELADASNCAACHGGLFSSMAEACLECHDAVAEHIEEGRGLHGLTLGEDVTSCGRCHSEHHGEQFELVNEASFAQAGVPDAGSFDHELVGFLMDGAHLEQACTQCHVNAEAETLGEDLHRYVGLEQDCASCHEDTHEGAMQLDCVRCHGQTDFLELEARGHGAQLPLVGGHAETACSACHVDGEPSALQALGEAGGNSAPRGCTACHESPHAIGFLAGVSWASELPRETSCAQCHLAEHDQFREPGLAIDGAQHSQSGFTLAAPHQTVGCAECHAGESFDERYPGRGPDDCSSCHADPHGGQFTQPERLAKDCLDCHAREQFLPHAFDAVAHAELRLPLEGAHAEQDCAACHADPEDAAVRVFRATPERCDSCHVDAHGDGLHDPDGRLTLEPRGSCAVCHDATRFDAHASERFEHEVFTDFPVLDAHAQADCEACHPRADEPDELGRRFGRVEEHFGPYEGCASCHADPHGGAFDLPGLPVQIDGSRDCARCHLQSSFRVPRFAFDHGLWTGHPLSGAHAELDCSACHEPSPGAELRSFAPAAGAACADCHADPHAGQFRVEGVSDCGRCHSSASGFAATRFDHELDASFQLGSAHAALACAECHEAYAWGSESIVRYRPLQTQCVDCHGRTEAELLRLLEEAR